jgi:hypothetical protein
VAALLVSCIPAAAFADQGRFRLDATAGLGYSSNPFLTVGDDKGSGFLELGLFSSYELVDEVSSSAAEAYYRRSQYLRNYDGSEAYGASLRTVYKINERLELRARAGLDSSILGERGSAVFVPVPPLDPSDPPEPLDPDLRLFGLGQRQNQLSADLGFNYRLSEADILGGDFELRRVQYDGVGLFDYTAASASASYTRALSERLQVGGRLAAQWIDYDAQGSSSAVYQPQLTASTQLSPLWKLTASAGLLIVRTRNSGVSDSSVGLSASVSGCRTTERSGLCLSAQRDAAPSGLGEVLRRTDLSADYSYRLDSKSTVRASVGLSRTGATSRDDLGAVTFARASAGYEREISRRLTGGVSLGYRDIYGSGIGQSADVNGQVFVRARLGSIE